MMLGMRRRASRALPVEPRLWPKVEKRAGGCWVWRGYTRQNGYGDINVHGRRIRVHRLVYEMLVGPIPTGCDLDHVCRERACVNPDHLEPVTRRENLRRGLRGILHTHCPAGHPLSGDNVGMSRGWRFCRTCKRAKDLRRPSRAKTG